MSRMLWSDFSASATAMLQATVVTPDPPLEPAKTCSPPTVLAPGRAFSRSTVSIRAKASPTASCSRGRCKYSHAPARIARTANFGSAFSEYTIIVAAPLPLALSTNSSATVGSLSRSRTTTSKAPSNPCTFPTSGGYESNSRTSALCVSASALATAIRFASSGPINAIDNSSASGANLRLVSKLVDTSADLTILVALWDDVLIETPTAFLLKSLSSQISSRQVPSKLNSLVWSPFNQQKTSSSGENFQYEPQLTTACKRVAVDR